MGDPAYTREQLERVATLAASAAMEGEPVTPDSVARAQVAVEVALTRFDEEHGARYRVPGPVQPNDRYPVGQPIDPERPHG